MYLNEYKALDKVKKEIIEVSTIDFREECITDKKYATKKFTDIELLPPTGVKDINKKESYLGDILKEPNNDKDFAIITKEENSNNTYLQYNYFVQGQHLRGVLPFNKIKEMHIVGNIYENPDMIKKEG